MKVVVNHAVYGKRNICDFLANHVDETMRVKKVFDNAMVFAIEQDRPTPEIHMEQLGNMLGCDNYLSEEEKAALEYAIDCIKTLQDMGVIK